MFHRHFIVRVLLVFCFFSLTTAPVLFAVDYHVRPGGSNSNSGLTYQAAWQTLQHAVESIAPGDTILVHGGTYLGCRIELSGTETAWKTLKAFPGDSVLINAPGPSNTHQSNIEIETWDGNGTVSYWVVEGLEVSNAPGWGIDIRGNDTYFTHHITVRHNTVHHNGIASGKTGIFLGFVSNPVIEYNESYANGEHGIYQSNSGDYPIIRGNYCWGNENCGIHMNGDESMGGDGMISYGTIENNVLVDNGVGGGSALNMDGVSHSLIRNNLLYNNHAGGFAVFQENGAACSHDNLFVHNTILMASDGRWAINITENSCINNRLYNNIIYTYHSYRGVITIPSATLSGFESDYNVILARFSADGDSTILDLSEWQALGFDLHSISSVPTALFVDSSADDYHLSESSPAKNNGIYMPEVQLDMDGVSRPQGSGVDIGCYEYQESQPVPTLSCFAMVLAISLFGCLFRRR